MPRSALSLQITQAACQMIRATGARLWFLPPYLPDLKPTEQAFAEVMHSMRPARKRTIEDTRRPRPNHRARPMLQLHRKHGIRFRENPDALGAGPTGLVLSLLQNLYVLRS